MSKVEFAILMNVVSGVIYAVACVVLTQFFARRLRDPIFRALALFFACFFVLALKVIISEIQRGATPPWDTVIWRIITAAAIWNVVRVIWAARPKPK